MRIKYSLSSAALIDTNRQSKNTLLSGTDSDQSNERLSNKNCNHSCPLRLFD